MNANSIVLALVIFMPTRSLSASISGIAGPYNVLVEELGNCPSDVIKTDESMILYGKIHHNRTSKGSFFSGNVTVNNNLVGSFGNTKGKLVIAKWDSVSGWRENFFIISVGDVCEIAARMLKPLMLHFHKHIRNFPVSCPVKKGVYIIDSVPAKFDGLVREFPIMPYFTYRAHAIGLHMKDGAKKLPAACMQFNGKIVPKARGE